MLAAILMLHQILQNVEDHLFYEQHDFSAQVSEALSSASAPFLVCLAGPKVHRADEQPALPFYVCFKENDVDNADLSTERLGNLVMSSVPTGELRVVKLYTRDKEPAAGAGDVEFPPGYEPSKTTYYRSEYKLVLADQLPRASGELVSIAQSGSFASEPYRCELRRSQETTRDDPWLAQLRLDPEEATILPYVTVTSVEDAPTVDAGFRFDLPSAAGIQPGEPLEVACRFVLPDDGNSDLRLVPIHLLLSGSQFEHLAVETVLVPKDTTSASDGLRQGRFTIDLSRHFYHPDTGGKTLEDDFYLTAVSREQVSAPAHVQVTEEE